MPRRVPGISVRYLASFEDDIAAWEHYGRLSTWPSSRAATPLLTATHASHCVVRRRAPVAHRPRFTKDGVALGRCRCPTPRYRGTSGVSSPSAKARTNSVRASDAVRSSSVAGLRSHRQSSEIQRYGVAVKQPSRTAGRVSFPSASQMAASTPALGGRSFDTPTHLLPIVRLWEEGPVDGLERISPLPYCHPLVHGTCARDHPKRGYERGLRPAASGRAAWDPRPLTGARALARASPRLSNSGAVWMTFSVATRAFTSARVCPHARGVV
jgi:hypothetical protein